MHLQNYCNAESNSVRSKRAHSVTADPGIYKGGGHIGVWGISPTRVQEQEPLVGVRGAEGFLVVKDPQEALNLLLFQYFKRQIMQQRSVYTLSLIHI